MKSEKKIAFILFSLLLLPMTGGYAYERTSDGILLRLQNSQSTGVQVLKLKVYADDILQVLALPGDSASAPASLIVDDKKSEDVEFKVEDADSGIHLMTNKLDVFIDGQTGEIT